MKAVEDSIAMEWPLKGSKLPKGTIQSFNSSIYGRFSFLPLFVVVVVVAVVVFLFCFVLFFLFCNFLNRSRKIYLCYPIEKAP